MNMNRKLITKRDAVILAVSIAAAVLVFIFTAPKEKGESAVVSVNGKVVYEIKLSEVKEKTEYDLKNGIILTAENGKIYFSESDCKNKICIGTGELSKAGDVAACVPNKTVVSIKGLSDGTDIVTY